jgi:hypothetical protein
MKHNIDGSTRLGTLRMSKVLELCKEQSIDTTELEMKQSRVNNAVAELETVIKSTLDGKLMVRIEPDEPLSTENVALPYKHDTYVSYPKRKNPTSSTTTKKELVSKKKAELRALLDIAEPGTAEYESILDQIIAL